MRERRKSLCAPLSNVDPRSGNHEIGWDSSSWYGDEDILSEWAKGYIQKKRAEMRDQWLPADPNAGHIPNPYETTDDV